MEKEGETRKPTHQFINPRIVGEYPIPPGGTNYTKKSESRLFLTQFPHAVKPFNN